MINTLFLGFLISFIVWESVRLYRAGELLASLAIWYGVFLAVLAFAISPWQFSF